MAEEKSERTLSHFGFYSLRDAYWERSPQERAAFQRDWLKDLRAAAPAVHLYQVYPAEAGMDLLVWSSARITDPCDTAQFFEAQARATNPHRRLLQPQQMLWGVTGPSSYSKARSTQEIDPFAEPRESYLVVYPFMKSAEWYLRGADTRQGMMNEHIRLGKQYPTIQQLLLYCFGMQDQEFVVVYEMQDLLLFSELVHKLRATEARRYTERDTPIHTAFYRPAEETLALWNPA